MDTEVSALAVCAVLVRVQVICALTSWVVVVVLSLLTPATSNFSNLYLL